MSNGRFLLNSISVLLSSFGRFLPSCFSVFLLVFILLFLLCFFPKTQKDQKYFCCFSSPFVYLVLCSYLLYLLSLVCYEKTQKDFALFACFLLFLFLTRKHQKYLLFFFGFVKFIREFRGLRWLKLGFISYYYSSCTSERQ